MWISNIDSSSGRASSDDASATTRAIRTRGAERVSARTQRRLVRSLKSLANRRPPRDRAHRRFEVLLHDRVALVRSDLLEIATVLQHETQPDPGCVKELHRLLTDGCESPLYNPDVHSSELRATVFYLRSRLTARYWT